MWSEPGSQGAPGKGGWGGLRCGLDFEGLVGLWGTLQLFRGRSGFGIPRDWEGGRDALGAAQLFPTPRNLGRE